MHRMVTISDSHGATQVGPGLATCGQWHWATTVTRHAAQCPLPATGSAGPCSRPGQCGPRLSPALRGTHLQAQLLTGWQPPGSLSLAALAP